MKQKFFNKLKSVRWFSGKDPVWIDDSGAPIPYKRTTKSERLAERKSKAIVMTALDLNHKLSLLKKEMKEASKEIYSLVMKENGIEKEGKGNFTWYNFDRTVKVEVNLSEPITFDEILIQAAKEKFDKFLKSSIKAKNEYVQSLVEDGFQTRKGKLDAKKIMDIVRHESRINDKLYSEAVELIKKSIRRHKKKKYYKVYIRDEEGQYKPIELNFSNVKIPDDE